MASMLANNVASLTGHFPSQRDMDVQDTAVLQVTPRTHHPFLVEPTTPLCRDVVKSVEDKVN